LAAPLIRGNFVKATVFADVDNRMRIAQDEIFGRWPAYSVRGRADAIAQGE